MRKQILESVGPNGCAWTSELQPSVAHNRRACLVLKMIVLGFLGTAILESGALMVVAQFVLQNQDSSCTLYYGLLQAC